jgi:hypothetical protein
LKTNVNTFGQKVNGELGNCSPVRPDHCYILSNMRDGMYCFAASLPAITSTIARQQRVECSQKLDSHRTGETTKSIEIDLRRFGYATEEYDDEFIHTAWMVSEKTKGIANETVPKGARSVERGTVDLWKLFDYRPSVTARAVTFFIILRSEFQLQNRHVY